MTVLALAVSGRGLVDPDEPVVHADDEAFMRGRGAFETLRVYRGRPFRFAEHAERLEGSCARLGLSAPRRGELEQLVRAALSAAGTEEAMLRIYATPGREARHEPLALAVVSDLPRGLEELRARGIRLATVEFRPVRLIGEVKSTSYAVNMVALDEADARCADDAVFLAANGTVLEATTSNVWWRLERTLVTPSLDVGILAGVTRTELMELAPALGYEVVEGAFPVTDLAEADEAFTSSSVREVMPAVALDGKAVGDGRPGPAARELQGALRKAACR